PEPAPQLAGRERRLRDQERPQTLARGATHARSAGAPARGHGTRDRGLALDAPNRAARHPDLTSNGTERQPGAEQLLDGMAIEHAEHPPWASGCRDGSLSGGRNVSTDARGRTEFREKSGQNLENQQQQKIQSSSGQQWHDPTQNNSV